MITNNGKRLLIALYSNVYETSVGQGIAYMDFFNEFGEVILVTTESNLSRIIEQCDVLAVPGGMDVLALGVGNDNPGFHAGKANPHYEYLDKYLMVPWIETGKPIIAICRGMQALNVHMGGTLHKHVSGHNQGDDEGTDEMYTDIPRYNIVKINTFHHQAVASIAPGFQVVGWSTLNRGCRAIKSSFTITRHTYIKAKESKRPQATHDRYPVCIECMLHEERPYVAFQYHPEDLRDDFSHYMITETLTTYFKQNNYAKESDLAGKKEQYPVI
jgi:anthranilate/para-aminobenzoate synthase component II